MVRCGKLCLLALILGVPAVPLQGAEELPAGEEFTSEERAAEQLTPLEWAAKLREWRKWVTTDTRNPAQTRAAAREQIAAIDDPAFLPLAIKALKTEKDSQMRRALIQPLVKFGGPEAAAMLVKLSVEDDNPVLREEAAKGLVGKPELAQHTKTYTEYLYKPLHSTAAARALRQTQLATRQSASDPIDPQLAKALVHALVEKRPQRVPGWIAHEAGSSSARTSKYFYTKRHVVYERGLVNVELPTPNPEVRQTLREYANQDYEFNQSSWRDALRTMPSP